MNDPKSWDSIDAYQLKECYNLASRFEKNDLAREILWEKSKQIDIPPDYVPNQSLEACYGSEMQFFSEVYKELSLEPLKDTDSSLFKYYHRINGLPDSGEKYYILALLVLRNGTDETHRTQALGHITAALSYSRNDPRFIALAEVLQREK